MRTIILVILGIIVFAAGAVAGSVLLKGVSMSETDWARQADNNLRAGMVLFEQRDYSAAKEFFEANIGRNPRDFNAQHYLGLSHYRLGEYPLAVEHLSQAKIINANSLNELALGYSLVHERKYAQASEVLSGVLTRGGDAYLLSRAFVGLGFASLATNDSAKATLQFNNAIALNDDALLAHAGLLHVHQEDNGQSDLILSRIAAVAEKSIISDDETEAFSFYSCISAKAITTQSVVGCTNQAWGIS